MENTAPVVLIHDVAVRLVLLKRTLLDIAVAQRNAQIEPRRRGEMRSGEKRWRADGWVPILSSLSTTGGRIFSVTTRIWKFMRDNWLSNRIFQSYDNLVDHCCDAWNRLIDQPWKIMSIGMRDWAHRF